VSKIRTGFVSNSSSSSFIISAKKGVPLKTTIEIDLKTLIESKIENTQQLSDYIVAEFGEDWKEDKYATDQFAALLKAIRNGEIVYVGSVGSEDDNPTSLYLYQNGLSGLSGKFNVIGDING
jgi:hypothetical protein